MSTCWQLLPVFVSNTAMPLTGEGNGWAKEIESLEGKEGGG